jgi:hypothetical protein
VCFINGKFTFNGMISTLFGELDYIYFELYCITVIFPHITSKIASEQVHTQSKTEYRIYLIVN